MLLFGHVTFSYLFFINIDISDINLSLMQAKTTSGVPEGFVLIVRPNGERCVIPEFLIPATNEAYDGYQKRMDMNTENEEGGVSDIFKWQCQ